MIRLCYSLFYYLMVPFLCVRWLLKSIRPPLYREPINERFGFVPAQAQSPIWFHAVSMGESKGAILIIKRLLSLEPKLHIVVTTTTPTGAKEILDALGDSVTHHYSPCDLPGTIKRFTQRIKPKLVVIMETELWPNWLHHLDSKNIPVVLANARLSAKSAKSYAFFAKTSRKMFNKITQILAVNADDGQRFRNIGGEASSIRVTGNIKYDLNLPNLNKTSEYFPLWQKQLVWIAASTHKGEDEVLLKIHSQLLKSHPAIKMILVPRHPQRFEEVAQTIANEKLSYSRRSDPETWHESAQVLLGDSMGEMMQAFQLSNVAFIGGSLKPIGGHNAMEAAILELPIISGQFVFNFQELFNKLELSHGAFIVENNDELLDKLLLILQDLKLRAQMGKNARQVILDNQGALDKTLLEIQKYL